MAQATEILIFNWFLDPSNTQNKTVYLGKKVMINCLFWGGGVASESHQILLAVA